MIPHNRPLLGAEEAAAAARVLRSGWIAQGPEVAAFEDELCAYLELPQGHGVAVSSGSAALYLALLSVGSRGERVAAPAYSCRAVQNAIELAGATPLWLDCCVDGPNLDCSAARDSDAQVIVVAHMYGQPSRFEALSDRIVVEDCAQALGSRIGAARAGTVGTIGVFSFGASKLLTTGGAGGFVASRNPELVEFVRKARDYDSPPDSHPRFNFQMTDIQAAIGRVQLLRLELSLARRRELFERYRMAGAELVDQTCHGDQPVRYRAVLRTAEPELFQEHLAGRGIQAIVPVRREELLAQPRMVPRAARLTGETLSLPVFPGLLGSEVDQVVAAIEAEFRG